MLALGANGRGRAGLLAGLRPQDVFATSLYTGTGASQQVSTGFGPDLSWLKSRSAAGSHLLLDSLRGTKSLSSDTTAAEAEFGFGVNSTGFQTNAPNGGTNVAWSLKRVAKFFDIVTYTGDGTSGRQIPHGLGVAPGMIVVKRRESTGSWRVYHNSLVLPQHLVLNTANAVAGNAVFGDGSPGSAPTSSVFTVGGLGDVNASGATYVAYLFAHDPDPSGIIQCGSFADNGNKVTLGWRPQYILQKRANIAEPWAVWDAARGFSGTSGLAPNDSTTEGSYNNGYPVVAADGFTLTDGGGGPYVYLAIRAPIT